VRGSLGLSAYRTLTGRRAPPEFTPSGPRPPGELVWIHAAEPGNNRALNDLAHRLIHVRHGCQILLTAAEGEFGDRGAVEVFHDHLPPDHPVTTDAFIAHWAPDLLIWTWGDLHPNLILSAVNAGTHMMLIDVAGDGFDRRRDRWLPDMPRALIAQFNHVTARDDASRQRLRQMGRPANAMELAPALHPFGKMLPVIETDLSDLTERIGGRPVWLAARAVGQECGMILSAHKHALKTSHRLLLILHIAQLDDANRVRTIASDLGLRVAHWAEGQDPDDNTQVLLTDGDDELGLWFRLAPVTFLGGSMHASSTGCDPYSAAAHGTAIIYGPNVGEHVDAFTKLMNAGAARIINSTDTLGRAVAQMIAPDQAAQMALAGWDVATQGADSLDRIIDMVQARLDARERGLD